MSRETIIKKRGGAKTKRVVSNKKRSPAKKRQTQRRKTYDSSDDEEEEAVEDEEEEAVEEKNQSEEDQVIAQGFAASRPPCAEPGWKKISDRVRFCLICPCSVYYASAAWPYDAQTFLIHWYSFLLLGDFSIQQQDTDVNNDTTALLMKNDFDRFFPWQTGKQFVLIRQSHALASNVHKKPMRWIDLWTLSYELVWQSIADPQDKESWTANRLFFLERCVVAKWLVNEGNHCLVHLMLDKDDTYYNRVDIGFYVFPVVEAPSFFVLDTANHEKYPWKSNGEHGWVAICSTFEQKVDYNIIEIEENNE